MSPSISSKVCSEHTCSWKSSPVRPPSTGCPFPVPSTLFLCLSVFLRHLPCAQYLLVIGDPEKEQMGPDPWGLTVCVEPCSTPWAEEPWLQGRAETTLDPEGCYIPGQRQDLPGGKNGITQGAVRKELGIWGWGRQGQKYSSQGLSGTEKACWESQEVKLEVRPD